jgi:hypothetical protein
MSRTIDEKFLLLFETAKFSLLTCEALLQQMGSVLSSVEDDLLGGVDIGQRGIPALISAISFVDFAHRFGQLIDSLPRISANSPEIRKLNRVLDPVERARNYLQHQRGIAELSSSLPVQYPVFGSLGWTKGDAAFMLALGQTTAQFNQYSPVYNTLEGRWVVKYEYWAKNTRVDLDKTLVEMKSAYQWVAAQIDTDASALTDLNWGKLSAIAVRIAVSAEGKVNSELVSANRVEE